MAEDIVDHVLGYVKRENFSHFRNLKVRDG